MEILAHVDCGTSDRVEKGAMTMCRSSSPVHPAQFFTILTFSLLMKIRLVSLVLLRGRFNNYRSVGTAAVDDINKVYTIWLRIYAFK